MKTSNKSRLEKLEKSTLKSSKIYGVLFYDLDAPFPETKGKGPHIFLPKKIQSLKIECKFGNFLDHSS
jgi:hypothetical protein